MSLIIGLHLGELVLIAADKREVRAWGDDILSWNDDANKIVDAGIGYVTGAGFVDLLDEVKCEITRTEITCTDQILDIVRAQQEKLRRVSAYDEVTTETYIRNTSWMFSYITEMDGCPRLRIGLASGSLEGHIGFVPDGTAYAFLPNEKAACHLKDLTKWLNERLRVNTDLPEISESLEYHASLLKLVFSDVSAVCKTVSDRFHIGAMDATGFMALSDEIDSSTTSVRFANSREAKDR